MSQRIRALTPASGTLMSAAIEIIKRNMTMIDHLRCRAAGRASVRFRMAASAATVRMAAARSSGDSVSLPSVWSCSSTAPEAGRPVLGNVGRSGVRSGFHGGDHTPIVNPVGCEESKERDAGNEDDEAQAARCLDEPVESKDEQERKQTAQSIQRGWPRRF